MAPRSSQAVGPLGVAETGDDGKSESPSQKHVDSCALRMFNAAGVPLVGKVSAVRGSQFVAIGQPEASGEPWGT